MKQFQLMSITLTVTFMLEIADFDFVVVMSIQGSQILYCVGCW